MKYGLQDKVITRKMITDITGELKIIDKGIKGTVVALGDDLRQHYLVEFEEMIYDGCGNKWWIYEEEIKKC